MSERYIGGLVYNPPGGWSVSFNGSTQYLSVADNAAFDFAAGDFTIEAWVNFNSIAQEHMIASQWPGASNRGWVFTIDATVPQILFAYTTNGTTQINALGTYSFKASTWAHVAVCRSSTNLRLFVNGAVITTYNISTDTIYNSTASMLVGAFQSGSTLINGYMSNFRIVKGTALYTAAFTPPTGALLPISGTSILTCAYPTIVDGSTNAFTITNNGTATVSTTNPFPTSVLPNPALGGAGNGIYTLSQYASLRGAGTWPAIDPYYENVTLNLHGNAGAVLPFNTDASTNNFQVTQVGNTSPSNYTPFIENGYWSNLFNGSSGVTVSSTSSQFGFAGDFTWEAWVNPSALPSSGGNYSIICSRGSVASNSAFQFLFGNSSGTYQITGTISISSSDSNLVWNISGTPSIGTWYHVAIVRSGTSVQAYWNGTAIGSAQTASGTTNTPTVNPTIGFRGGSYNDLFFNGYISNFRMVGSAVYTGNFTPSTTPLTAISGTRILTCQSNRFVDNSTNGFTLTAYSSPSVNPLQPFTAPTGTSAYGSGYFDGSGDYLTVANNTALELGSSDFTIECWVYPTGGSGTSRTLIGKRSAGANYGGYSIFIDPSNNFGLVADNDTSAPWPVLITGGAVSLNQWVHLAATRSGSTWTLWQNGISTGTASSSITINTASTNVGVGAIANGDQPITGYISNARIVKGTAVYTSAFTPPTSPLTAITNTSLLTVQTNAPSQNNTFLDSSINNFVITRNGNTTQGTFTPYGSNWSNYFDGSGDYLSVADANALDFAGDFTVEAWVFVPTTSASARTIIHKADTNVGYALVMISAGNIEVQCASLQFNSTSTLPLNQWNHVAMVRSGSSANNVKFYLNGVLDGQGTNTTDTASSVTLGIGAVARSGAAGVNPLNGYISNVRTVASAVYTSSFTPSTTPLTAITNTSLLTCQSNRFIDNSTNNFTITKNGDTSVQRFSPFSPTTAYSTSVIGGSGYFDGSGDYLSVASNDAFRVDQGDWTIEGWVYITSTGSNFTLANRGVYVSVYSFYCGSSGTSLYYEAGTGGWAATGYTSSSGALVAGQWNHIAYVRSGTSLYMYSNGNRVFSQVVASVGANVTAPMWVGQYLGGSAGLNGNMTDFRFVKGTAVYTGATYTVPTSPLTAITNTSLLLSYTNAGILDNAMMNDLETVGNAQISTSVKKYGTGSMYFDGTGDYLFRPSSPLYDFGTGDFTLEMWVYRNGSQTAYAGLVGFSVDSGNGLILGFGNADNKLRVVWNNAQTILASTAMTNTTWTHVALVRSGATVTCYQDGTSVGTSNISTSAMPFTGAGMVIGRLVTNTDNYYFNGYIDDLRITKGVARYTTTFTPPTSQVQDQ